MVEAEPAFSPPAWRGEHSSSSGVQVRTKRLHPRAGVLGQQLGQWFPKCGPSVLGVPLRVHKFQTICS